MVCKSAAKSYLTIFLFLLLISNVSASIENTDYQLSGEQVMGREMTTTFDYDVSERPPVQVSFVIDDTGSMGGEINDIKNNIKQFFRDLGPQAEGSIVTFKDSAELDQSFTSNENTLESTVDSISAGGGGDCKEDASGGLSLSKDNLDWKGDRTKVVILVLGAGLHDPNRIRNLADQFASNGYTAYTVTDGLSCNSASGADAVHDYLPGQTGGKNYRFGTDWSKILNDISGSATDNRNADLHAVLPSSACRNPPSCDSYDSLNSGQPEYVIEDIPVSGGSHQVDVSWYPTTRGDNVQTKTGNSYVEFTEQGETTNYYFGQTQSNQIDYVDFNVFDSSVTRKNGEVNVSVSVRNDGNTGSRETDFRIYDESGNGIDETLSALSPREEIEFSYMLDEPHSVFDDAEMIRAKADVSGLWGGDGKELEPNEADSIRKLGFPVLVNDISPESLEYEDTFAEQIDIDHPEYSSLSGTYDFFKGPNKFYSNTYSEEDVFYSDTGNIVRTEDYTVDRVETHYNFTNTVTDTYGSKSVFNYSKFVDNTPPTSFNPDPRDGAIVTGDSNQAIYVSVVSSDLENESLNIYYFNGSDKLIGKRDVSNGERSQVLYPGTTVGESYEWYVKVSDGFDNYTSNRYTFTKTTSASYRTEPRIEYKYSSIIMSETGTQDISLVMENQIDEPKDLRTYLSGVNATFADNNQDSITYSLDRYSERRFVIRIEPESVGSKSLDITTENQKLGVNTTTSIPVNVKNYTDVSDTSEVSGIGVTQMILLLLISSSVYITRM